MKYLERGIYHIIKNKIQKVLFLLLTFYEIFGIV